MNFCTALWDIFLTAIGLIIGLKIALWHEKRKASELFIAERKKVLADLLFSLKKNDEYLDQVTDTHFAAGELPTYPLDTVALAYVSYNARRFLPEGTEFAERYNKLRFELDHVNQRIKYFFTISNILSPTDESFLMYDGKDGVLNTSIDQKLVADFEGLLVLVGKTKKTLKAEIELLEKFA